MLETTAPLEAFPEGGESSSELEASRQHLGEVLSQARADLPEDPEARRVLLTERQSDLALRPLLTQKALQETLSGAESKGQLAWVDPRAILGRTFAWPGRGWAYEFASREGRVQALAERLATEEPEKLEDIVHLTEPRQRIQLTEIPGPSGPLYMVDDGTHRVIAALVAGLPELPAQVKRIRYPLVVDTTSAEVAAEWQRLIDRGLVEGQIEESDGRCHLTVTHEVLPWIRTANEHDLATISRTYESLYPGSLDDLEIPRAALIDPTAFNFYRAGRWDEWWTTHSHDLTS